MISSAKPAIEPLRHPQECGRNYKGVSDPSMADDRIDLNGDVGEGIGQDPDLIPVLTSANIACGAHAGDESTMRSTVALARRHAVAIGAHPSYPDREGFGRRALRLSPAEIETTVVAQIRALRAIAHAAGIRLQHVKPHGALYNVAARDATVAGAIARATAMVDDSLFLVGLAGSELLDQGARAGLRIASEVFADRAYRADGTLVPRDHPDSVLHDAAAVIPRAVAMVRHHTVTAVDGHEVSLRADTICVHGDTPGAAALAARIRQALVEAGVIVKALGLP
jgi:UPF0271 protein